MSTVDLNNLIGRKKFSVPIKSHALSDVILQQLKLDDYSWSVTVKRSKSGILELSWRRKWACLSLVDEGKPLTDSNITKRMKKFGKAPFKYVDETVKRILKHVPYKVHYVITKELTDGCICEISCFPTLYFQKVRGLDTKCDKTDVQHSRLHCEEFLIDIFVGGLGGKEILERKEVSRWELLINDVDSRHITDCIHEMLEQATGEVLLMGWVGTDCLPKLKELKNKGVRIQAVTHKPSEMKSPVPKDIGEGYTNLVKILGKTNVSTNRELHGRAIIVDNKALIGSMDMNAHSLSGEHREFAIYTEDVDTVRKIRAYFKKIFVPLKQDQ